MDRYLRLALDEITGTVGNAPPAQLRRALPGKWSGAEILEHLTLAFTGTRLGLERALTSDAPHARRPRLWQHLVRTLVVDFGYFPRVKTPEKTTPRGTVPPERAFDAIRDALTAMDEALDRGAARFGDARVTNHPYFDGMTVAEWRKFHWRHTRHHMKQLRAAFGARE